MPFWEESCSFSLVEAFSFLSVIFWERVVLWALPHSIPFPDVSFFLLFLSQFFPSCQSLFDITLLYIYYSVVDLRELITLDFMEFCSWTQCVVSQQRCSVWEWKVQTSVLFDMHFCRMHCERLSVTFINKDVRQIKGEAMEIFLGGNIEHFLAVDGERIHRRI